MKAIFKVLLFIFTLVMLSQCEKETEPNTVTIPDDNFLNALIELGVDTNGDGEISPAEAEVITSLDVSNNTALYHLYLKDMPSLNRVCVWTLPFPPSGMYVDTGGSPNVYFTTDCSK